MTILLLFLAGANDAATAGEQYRLAIRATREERYDEAVAHLREALRFVGQETERLAYRDEDGRRRHPYRPYYEWARARLLQARGDEGAAERRTYYQEALNALEQTGHPLTNRMKEEARAGLERVRTRLAAEARIGEIRDRIVFLIRNERFVEAAGAIDQAAADGVPDDLLSELRRQLASERTRVLDRLERARSKQLESIAARDRPTRAAGVRRQLQLTLVPETVLAEPDPATAWTTSFLDLYQERIGTPAERELLPPSETVAIAAAFEKSAHDALDAGLPRGWLAARSIARAIRVTALESLAAGTSDTYDMASARILFEATDRALEAAESALRSLDPDDETTATLRDDLAAERKRMASLRRSIEAGDVRRRRLTAPILEAEEALAKPGIVADAKALATLRNRLFELESDGAFGTLTPALRARALFAHAIAEAMAGYLEGEAGDAVIDRFRTPAWRAYGFDPAVDARWKKTLSPKILALFEAIKPK